MGCIYFRIMVLNVYHHCEILNKYEFAKGDIPKRDDKLFKTKTLISISCLPGESKERIIKASASMKISIVELETQVSNCMPLCQGWNCCRKSGLTRTALSWIEFIDVWGASSQMLKNYSKGGLTSEIIIIIIIAFSAQQFPSKI